MQVNKDHQKPMTYDHKTCQLFKVITRIGSLCPITYFNTLSISFIYLLQDTKSRFF